MLARSHSTAGKRLRRAKSNSSNYGDPHNSSAQAYQFLSEEVIQSQAVTAAVTAYGLSHDASTGVLPDDRSNGTRSNLQRRQSRRHGRSEGEGSHFSANSQVPRRQSSRKSVAVTSPAVPGRSRREGLGTTRETRIATPPLMSKNWISASSTEIPRSHPIPLGPTLTPASASYRSIRKSRSLYNTSSPPSGHLHTTVLDNISFGSRALPPYQPPDILSTSLNMMQSSREDPPFHVSHENKFEVSDEVSKARDEYLQNFQKSTRKMKRPSIFFSSFQKRQENIEPAKLPMSASMNDGEVHRKISPIYNELPVASQSRDRTGSQIGFRDRLKRAFRRTSADQPIVLPVQQVESVRPHYGYDAPHNRVGSYSFHSVSNPLIPATPSRPAPPPPSHSESIIRSASPVCSEHSMITDKSRVTSWTDSTINGSVNSQAFKRLTIIEENGQTLTKSPALDSRNVSEASQAPSIFRRILRKPARIGSGHIASAVNTEVSDDQHHSTLSEESALPTPSAIGSLPSQKVRTSSTFSSRLRFRRPTVRAVSPESLRKASSSSVVRRAVTPASVVTETSYHAEFDEAATPKPIESSKPVTRQRNRLRKPSPVPRVSTPSESRGGSRAEQFRSRWKAPTDDTRSLFYPRSPRKKAAGRHELPYEQSVPPQSIRDLRIRDRDDGTISPSVYSRDTDVNQSTTSLQATIESCNGGTGVAIITPSRQVSSFPVGSPQKPGDRPGIANEEKTLKTSRDWRMWLSKEVADLETPPPGEFSLNADFVPAHSSDSKHVREQAQIHGSDEEVVISAGTVASSSPAVLTSSINPKVPRPSLSDRPQSSVIRPRQPPSAAWIEEQRRPSSRLEKQDSRPSSRMNDRFPLIETGRPPSRTRKFTPPLTSALKKIPSPEIQTSVLGVESAAESNKENVKAAIGTTAPPLPPKSLRRPQSAAAIGTVNRSTSSLAHYAVSSSSVNTTSHIPVSTSGQSIRPRAMTSQSSRTMGTAASNSLIRQPLRRPNSALAFRPMKKPSDLGQGLDDYSRSALSKPLSPDSDASLAAVMRGPYGNSHQSSFNGSSSSIHTPLPTRSTRQTPSPYKVTPTSVRAGTLTPRSGLHTEDLLPSSETDGKQGSPGQRMADHFLKARKWREDLVISPSPGAGLNSSPAMGIQEDRNGRTWQGEERMPNIPAFL